MVDAAACVRIASARHIRVNAGIAWCYHPIANCFSRDGRVQTTPILCARAAIVEEILFARESSGPASRDFSDTDARMVGVNTDVDIGIVAAIIARATFIARDCVNMFEGQRSRGNCILR